MIVYVLMIHWEQLTCGMNYILTFLYSEILSNLLTAVPVAKFRKIILILIFYIFHKCSSHSKVINVDESGGGVRVASASTRSVKLRYTIFNFGILKYYAN